MRPQWVHRFLRRVLSGESCSRNLSMVLNAWLILQLKVSRMKRRNRVEFMVAKNNSDSKTRHHTAHSESTILTRASGNILYVQYPRREHGIAPRVPSRANFSSMSPIFSVWLGYRAFNLLLRIGIARQTKLADVQRCSFSGSQRVFSGRLGTAV